MFDRMDNTGISGKITENGHDKRGKFHGKK
jgi:hypothetical protein